MVAKLIKIFIYSIDFISFLLMIFFQLYLQSRHDLVGLVSEEGLLQKLVIIAFLLISYVIILMSFCVGTSVCLCGSSDDHWMKKPAKRIREVCRKSKWKFKMAFAIKGGGTLDK